MLELDILEELCEKLRFVLPTFNMDLMELALIVDPVYNNARVSKN